MKRKIVPSFLFSLIIGGFSLKYICLLIAKWSELVPSYNQGWSVLFFKVYTVLKDDFSLYNILIAVGIYLGKDYVDEQALNQQEEEERARINIKILLKELVEYVKKVVEAPSPYEYKGYYPEVVPEISDDKGERYPERPYRLIYNKRGDAWTRLYGISQLLSLKKRQDFEAVLGKLEKLLQKSLGLLNAHASENEEIKLYYFSNITAISTEIEEIMKKIDKL